VSTFASALDDYAAFCDGVRRLTKIDLGQYKRAQMERRIRAFAERRGASELGAYLNLLERGDEELDEFLHRMTINVSQLWRNPEQWASLARTVIPELAAAGRIRIWSAGCSYGAEAYTIAAVCREAVPAVRVEVLGSDIDRRVVDRARAGVFAAEDARDVPRASLERWFEPAGDGGWAARKELRRLVRFETGDLLRDRFPAGAYDLVLCRNVVIYFTGEVRDALHARLAAALRPGGYLVVGATERVTAPAASRLRTASPFVYRKL
jgi:chemotaxis protein methyltransferase CheR